MADFISREAEIQFFNGWVDDLDKQINDSVNHPHLRSDYKVCKTQLLDCINAIKEMPAANVRPVVLCRDCKWFGEKKDSLRGCCALLGIYPAKDWYCAFGTRLTNCGADMRPDKNDQRGEQKND